MGLGLRCYFGFGLGFGCCFGLGQTLGLGLAGGLLLTFVNTLSSQTRYYRDV